jgi:hypothetical protein
LPSRTMAGCDAPGRMLRRATTASVVHCGLLREHALLWRLGQQGTRGDINMAGTEKPPSRRMIGGQRFRYDRGGRLIQTHQGTWNSISPPLCPVSLPRLYWTHQLTVFRGVKCPEEQNTVIKSSFSVKKKTESKLQVDSSRYRRRGARAAVVAKNLRSERAIQ